MEIVKINKAVYQHFTSGGCAYPFTRSRPTFLEDETLYKYPYTLEISFDEEDMKKMLALYSQNKPVFGGYHKYIILEDVIKYIQSFTTEYELTNYKCSMYTKFYETAPRFKIHLLDNKSKVKILNLTKKDIEVRKKAKDKQANISVIRNLLMPSINTIFQKYGLRAFDYDDTCTVSFGGNDDNFRKMIEEGLKHTVFKDLNEIGLNVQLLKTRKKVTSSSELFDLFDAELILKEE